MKGLTSLIIFAFIFIVATITNPSKDDFGMSTLNWTKIIRFVA